MATPDADPEFLALSERQRRAVDRAFNRGLRLSGGRRAKRRKLDTSRSASASASTSRIDGGGFVDEGGFVDDGGGFLPDDGGGFVDDAGGFLPDDGGGFVADDGDAGGFLPDDSGPSTMPATPADSGEQVPLRLVPVLLSSLSLPADDDVLAVFRASASGWDAQPGEEADPAVGLKDFRAVCAALMEPEEEAMDVDTAPVSSDDASSDGFEPSELSEPPSEADDDDEYGARPKPARRTRKSANAQLEVTRIKLNPHQRELARDIWAMLKPDASGPGSGILGRDEVKRWAREMGEMWSDEEITDMVQLFSSQHEGRGLTFEDFGIVMVRAGLV